MVTASEIWTHQLLGLGSGNITLCSWYQHTSRLVQKSRQCPDVVHAFGCTYYLQQAGGLIGTMHSQTVPDQL